MLSPIIAGEPSRGECLEQTTPKYTFTIVDDDGEVIPGDSLATLTLSLYVIAADGTQTILNNRDAQNVLQQNNVLVNAYGVGTWLVQEADTTLEDDTLPYEAHIALWTWTYAAGTKIGRHEFVLNVKNLLLVP